MLNESFAREMYEKGQEVGYLKALRDSLDYAVKVALITCDSSVLAVCEHMFNLYEQHKG